MGEVSVPCAFLHVVLALAQACAYFYSLHTLPGQNRKWCIVDHMTTDCLGEEGKRSMRSNSTNLQVVLPSYGQTGTTSVTLALREMGYWAYHADDYCIYSRTLMWDKFDYGFWARGVTRCRMEAIALEPTTDVVRMAVAMSPKAKFILTWRNFESWMKSTRGARSKEVRWGVIHAAHQKACRFIPWHEMWDDMFGTIRRVRERGEPFAITKDPITAYVYRTACNGYQWTNTNYRDRGTFKSQAAEESLLAHMNEIRMLVPKERLLEFDVTKHGWAELEQFLGKSSGRAGTPFPRPRTKESRTNDVILETHWQSTRWSLMIFNFMHGLNMGVVSFTMRFSVLVLCLIAWVLGAVDWPLEGAGERWESAINESPIVAIIEGVSSDEAVRLGEALVGTGVRSLAVPLHDPEAARTLRLLADALPDCVALGGSTPRGVSDVKVVYEARGHFVLGTVAGSAASRRARSFGLASIQTFCTPSEGAAALRGGTCGVAVAPVELVGPSAVQACRCFMPRRARVLVSGRADIQTMEEYLAAGAHGFVVPFGRTHDDLAESTAFAAALLSVCRASALSAARPQPSAAGARG